MDLFGPDATMRSARNSVKVQAALARLDEASRGQRSAPARLQKDLGDSTRSEARLNKTGEAEGSSANKAAAEARTDLHRLVNSEILILMREYYRGVAPWRVQTGLMGQLAKGEEALKTLLQMAGVAMPSAIASTPESDVLAQFFPAEDRLEIPETAVLRSVAASGAMQKTNVTRVGGPVYASAGLFNRLVDDNPRALFFLLSAFRNIALQTKTAFPVLETSGPANLPGRIRAALSNKKAGITNDAEREAILKDLESFLKVNPLEAGQGEAVILNGRIAALNGRMATLHLDDALLPMLEGGVNVAIGERVGDEDLLLAVGLAVQLTLFAGSNAEALLKQMQDRGVEMKAKGAYSLVLSNVAQLGEELVHAALIARSA